VAAGRRGLDGQRSRLDAALRRGLDRRRAAFAAVVARLEALSPLRVLERGYALTTRGGHVVTDAGTLHAGDEVELRFAIGRAKARVTETE
jgi:exodeoxyribonuclease VII large subunit